MNVPTLTDSQTYQEIIDKVIELAQDDIIIVEIGVFLGGTTCYIASKLAEKGVRYTYIAIDNFKFTNISHEHNQQYSKNVPPYIAYSTNLRKTQAKVNTFIGDSIEISKVFKDKSIDFLYIDGDHSEYCIGELEAWLPKMKEDSVIAGHDYCDSEFVRQACKKHLKDFELTTNNASYYKQFGEGIMAKQPKPTKIIKPKLWFNILFYLYGWYRWFIKGGGK